MQRLLIVVLGSMVFAGANCQPNDACDLSQSSLDNPFHPTGSHSLAVSTDRQFVVTANKNENSLTLLRSSDLTALHHLDIGLEPERIAPVAGGFVVSLSGERGLARVTVSGDKLSVALRADTGAEPIGLVADEAGEKLYVAVSQSGRVEERDAQSLALIRSFEVSNEPRWLALHPSGQTLYVATAMGGHLIIVDLLSGELSEHDLPVVNVPSQEEDFQMVARNERITGDLAVRPNGTQLFVPVLYIDNINSIDADPDERGNNNSDGYGGSDAGGKRFIGAVASIDLDKTGKPTGRGEVQEIEAVNNNGNRLGGYISSINVHPTQDVAFATLEASNTLASFTIDSGDGTCSFGSGLSADPRQDPLTTTTSIGMPDRREMPRESLEMASQRGFTTRAGPSGVVFVSADKIMVHGRIDRSVERLDMSTMTPETSHDQSWNAASAELSASTGPATLERAVAKGLRMFFSSNEQEMSGHNVNVSCSTCHFDGRNDGLTWKFSTGPRQTPSLAGDVSATEPVTWADDIATVADEVRLTSQSRMGGSNISDASVEAVTSYVNWRRHVDLPNHGLENAIIDEGRALFRSEEVGCSACHSGDQFTDSQVYRMRGKMIRTPSLRGLAATAPYFHDGSSASVSELLERSRDGSMGNTRDLSTAQMAALEAYLLSL
jgi:DNA-binding beta-propeller fold protein YncE/mono/diheme cytochrome c family protein